MTQGQALDILKMGKNAFVTGPAGSGKTHLINTYIEYLNSHNIAVGITASTGIAATHMGGVTIHSWSGMGIKSHLSERDFEQLEEKQYLFKRFERVKVLIIDEVSMLHHFRLDLVDRILRRMKKNDEPFGGIQVIVCGDFFQLPPVTRRGEGGAHFAYKSRAWEEAGFVVCYLSEQFRQKDGDILTILQEIRSGEVSEAAYESLMIRLNAESNAIEPTRLFTHNVDVDILNSNELAKLSEREVRYEMYSKGNEHLCEFLKKSCLAPEILKLRVGARVMCVKNNFEAGYVNGTLGIVVSAEEDEDPVIRTVKGDIISISRTSWSIEEDGKVKAEISQYPLRLAWAITVHKSQGMSLDAVHVDLSKSFEPGMGYVALSRVRTLDGLVISGINAAALMVHPEILEIDAQFRCESEDAERMLETIGGKEVVAEQKRFLDRNKPKEKEKKLSTYEKTLELVGEKKKLDEMARTRGVTAETIIEHLETLVSDGENIDIAYLKREISPVHFQKIAKAFQGVFEKTNEAKLSSVKEIVGPNISYKEIRLARLLLGYFK